MTEQMTRIAAARRAMENYRDEHDTFKDRDLTYDESISEHNRIRGILDTELQSIGYANLNEFFSENAHYNDNATIEEAEELTILWI